MKRVLITGARGFIGYSVAKAFKRRGYQVFGLIRNQEAANLLHLNEIIPIIHDLSEMRTSVSNLPQVDIVVHCASSKTEKAFEDAKHLEALFQLNPSKFLYTSGCWSLGSSPDVQTEEKNSGPLEISKWRLEHEQKVQDKGGIVLRPGCVYGGRGGLTGAWFESAEKGQVNIVGDGSNCWSMIHHLDLGESYVQAAETSCNGHIFNINDGSSIPISQIASSISQMLNIPQEPKYTSFEEAFKEMGHLAEALCANQVIANQKAIRLLEWRPYHTGFINNIKVYYDSWKTYKAMQERQKKL